MKFCKRCLLPETYPKLEISSSGVCNVCTNFDKKHGSNKKKKSLLEELKKTNENKFVATCSGGIDSSYSLYLCKEKYKIDIVPANFDHGFVSDVAKENLKNISEILDIPINTKKPDYELMYRFYRDFLFRTGDFCTPCCQGCYRAGFRVAKENGISTILHGGVSGSELEFNALGMLTHDYNRFMRIVGDDYTKEELESILTTPEEISKFNLIAMPQHEDWKEEDIINVIQDKLNWQFCEDGRKRHVDCLVADVSNHLLQLKFGFSKLWMDISANIRAGIIDVDEGRKSIKEEEKKISVEPKEAMAIFLDRLKITREDVYSLPFFKTKPIFDEL